MVLFFLPLGLDVGATSAARGLHSAKPFSIDVRRAARKPLHPARPSVSNRQGCAIVSL